MQQKIEMPPETDLRDKNRKRLGLKVLVERALGLGQLVWCDRDDLYGGSSTAKLPGDYWVSVIVEIGESNRHWAVMNSAFSKSFTIEEYKERMRESE